MLKEIGAWYFGSEWSLLSLVVASLIFFLIKGGGREQFLIAGICLIFISFIMTLLVFT